MTKLAKYSLGTGDRFVHQADAQLAAVCAAAEKGIQLDIVWNKSYREHKTIGSDPSSTRMAADAAVSEYREREHRERGDRNSNADSSWQGSYFLDADHIGMQTVDLYLPYAEFYTLDVADHIGLPCGAAQEAAFRTAANGYASAPISVPGLSAPVAISSQNVDFVVAHFLQATHQAGELYRYIKSRRGDKPTIIEVSMDETSRAQSPQEIFLILLALSLEDIPLQTFAPRFSGRFNKGVDYVGDVTQFADEFEKDALILRYAASEMGFPDNLKLSLHSGSDKFAIYPAIHQVLAKHDVGIHVKTAGTTWLEEVIGLLEAGEADIVKTMYIECLNRIEELTAPYAEVIDIDNGSLPSAEAIADLTAVDMLNMLRHNTGNALYNPSFRQLFHVGYKVAAGLGSRYTDLLQKHRNIIAREVTANLLDRHILPLWAR